MKPYTRYAKFSGKAVLMLLLFLGRCGYAQQDSAAKRSFSSERHYRADGGVHWKNFVTWHNDFENNPALSSFDERLTLNVNHQYTYMGKNYLGYEYNARVNHRSNHLGGGLSLRYQSKNTGLFNYQYAGFTYSYLLRIIKSHSLSIGLEVGALQIKYDWGHTTLPDMMIPSRGSINPSLQPAPEARILPDFNAGLIYTNKNLIVEANLSHLFSPNQAFYSTPGQAYYLRRTYFTRLSCPIKLYKSKYNRQFLLPGISWSGVDKGKNVFGMYIMATTTGVYFVSCEYTSDHAIGARLSLKVNGRLRLGMGYKKYMSLSKELEAKIGGFRFGVNYIMLWSKWKRHYAPPLPVPRF